jgi:hypothetical protein
VVGVDNQQKQAEGTLGQADDAGFRRRYGTTYVLLDEEGDEVSYALKSDTDDLGKSVGQHVLLSGFLVEGFPVEAGGLGYISVKRIVGEAHDLE